MKISLFVKHCGGKLSIMGVRWGWRGACPESSYQWASSKLYYIEAHLRVSMMDPIDCQGQRAQPSLLEAYLSCQEGVPLGGGDWEPQISRNFISGKPPSLEASAGLPPCCCLKMGQARLVLSVSLTPSMYRVCVKLCDGDTGHQIAWKLLSRRNKNYLESQSAKLLL